jgi:hypothetical protein
MKITHCKHYEINRQKWNTCILNACNSLVYAESWFLDIVSPDWEALIGEDYEYVMPLPVKKKFGISFLVQPPFTQQLGVFSSLPVDENIIKRFIQKIPCRSYHLCLNEQNPYSKGIKQPNFILSLNKDYDTLSSAYSTNTKRNLKKAYSYNIKIQKDISANDFLKFYHATEKNYNEPPEKVNKLILNAVERGSMTVYGAYNTHNMLIAALCLLHSRQRLIYWLPVSNQEGKNGLAMFRIINEIIQKYENQEFIFDFSGSSVPNIARFYQGFNAKMQSYVIVKHWSVNDLIEYLFFWK